MSTKEEILSYVQHTPSNTNVNVLGAMLNNLSGGGSLPQVTEQDNGSVLIVKDGVWKKQSGYGYQKQEEQIIYYSEDMEKITIELGGITEYFLKLSEPISFSYLNQIDALTISINGETYTSFGISFHDTNAYIYFSEDIQDSDFACLVNTQPLQSGDYTLNPGFWIQSKFEEDIDNFDYVKFPAIVEKIDGKFINTYYRIDTIKDQSDIAEQILNLVEEAIENHNNIFLLKSADGVNDIYHLTSYHIGMSGNVTQADFINTQVVDDEMEINSIKAGVWRQDYFIDFSRHFIELQSE